MCLVGPCPRGGDGSGTMTKAMKAHGAEATSLGMAEDEDVEEEDPDDP